MAEQRKLNNRRGPRKILGVNSLQNSERTELISSTYVVPTSSTSAPIVQPALPILQQQAIPPLAVQQHLHMERLRLANIMNQEMHTLWPYGTTFLSPMLPAPNVALPYALAGTLPYAAVPIYPQAAPAAMQQQQQQCAAANLLSPVGANGGSGAPSTPSSLRSMQSINSNESSKINIQIGLQCMNQNNSLNFNPMSEINTSMPKVHLLNFSGGSMEKENKEFPTNLISEPSSSQRSSPIILSSDSDLNSSSTNTTSFGVSGAGGDAADSSSTVTLSQAKFNELTRLALRGSEIAEKLAYTHRNRPCFKKIDSLCARMKQDLIRPDGVLPNINSQGIAWAVKDFIFVFTRVINAWIIIKGYVYNTPEGLSKVKAALSPEFATSFAAWQDTTMDFVENLIKSFVNLDNLVQSQKNVYQKTENITARASASTPIKLLQPGSTLLDDSFDFLNSTTEKSQQSALNKNYLYTMVEDSEGSQRQATANGTYFKTGTYNPIKKETLLTDVTPTTSNSTSELPDAASNAAIDQYFPDELSEFWAPSGASEVAIEPAGAECIKIKEKIPPNWLNYDIRVLEQNLSEFSNDYDPNEPPRPLGRDLIEKLNVMIERLMAMKNADLFFKLQFTKNYFPDFIKKHSHDFKDIRSIILKCQVGGYHNIFEVVHDIKKIIYTGKKFLKISTDVQLQKSVGAFEVEFNKLLSEPPFENYQFEHILGEPTEILYNYRSK